MLNIFLQFAWLFFMIVFSEVFRALKTKNQFTYGCEVQVSCFFLLTFLEQNLWHIAWFRNTFIKEMTIQWKSNGSMVGACNQMIYGTAIYLMIKISGDEKTANTRKVYFTFFLSLNNLIFNGDHRIYNLPAASWIRCVSYGISMTEWILLINIMQGFKHKLKERNKYLILINYKFLNT